MNKGETKQTEQEPICEFGISAPDGRLYLVEGGFQLNVKLGPLLPVRKGDIVRLSERTAIELFFSNKISPLEIAEEFEAVRPFRTVKDGEWLDIEKGDTVRLNRDEALQYLKQGNVKERRILK